MNDTFDPVTLIMIAAAVIVFFKLRSVLGQRTGHQNPFDPFEKPSNSSENQSSDQETDKNDDDTVVQMPSMDESIKDEQPSVWEGVAEKNSEIATKLEQIQAQDLSFSATQFLDGARAAYEMIVVGFAQSDKKSLKNLLSKEVYAGFAAAIDDRKKQGVEMATQFIGIEKAEIANAELEKKKALLTVSFVSELVSVVKDKNGKIVDGDPTEIQEITDIWTFERNLASKDPNWRLVATDGDDA